MLPNMRRRTTTLWAGTYAPWGTLITVCLSILTVLLQMRISKCVWGVSTHTVLLVSAAARSWLYRVLPVSRRCSISILSHPGRGHAVIERRGSEPDHRDFSEAVAGVLGLDVIVNTVINSRREICGLFVGDFVQAHRKGAHFALDTYGTEIPETSRKETDLVVLNCYPLDSDPIQTGKALWALSYFEKAYRMALNPASRWYLLSRVV